MIEILHIIGICPDAALHADMLDFIVLHNYKLVYIVNTLKNITHATKN